MQGTHTILKVIQLIFNSCICSVIYPTTYVSLPLRLVSHNEKKVYLSVPEVSKGFSSKS